jgi:hypothetical protein
MRQPDFFHERQVARRPHIVAPNLSSVRVVLVAQQGKPCFGSGMGLSVTSVMTAKMLRGAGVHCNVWNVPDAETLKLKLKADEWRTDRPITHVIINTPCFVGPLCYCEMAQAWPDITFVMLNHTGLAYLSIDHDGWRNIRWLLDLQSAFDNVVVAGNSPRFPASVEAQFGNPSVWLPNLYDTTLFKPVRHSNSSYAPLRIGSFAEGRPWKNQLVAAQAALAMAREVGASGLELYVNQDRWQDTKAMSQSRSQLFENLPNAKLVPVHWQSWSSFLKTVEAMDVMLYASYDESFGMVPADGIAVGVPSVTAAALEWTPRSWQAAEPFDPASIASVGLSLLHGRIGAIHAGRKALVSYVEAGVRRWLEYLTK